MPTPELGRIEQVNIREVWPHEEYNFTPWLADNLHLLGDALGMKLELDQREAAVGPYSLDILAREADTGVLVAIENQLEETDHSHLGQLLTYAAGYDVRVVIWVTPYFRDEHRAAIDWLNRWTPEEIEFYAVEVRAIKISDSLPAPEFRPVAFPNGWTKKRQSGLSPSGLQFRDFFRPLVDELRTRGFSNRTKAYGRHYRHFSSDFKGIYYSACFVGGSTFPYAYIHIEPQDREFGKRIFDALQETSAEIEANIDAEWEWRRLDRRNYCNVGLRRDGSIGDRSEMLEEIRAWMLEYLPKLKEVLDPHLERVLKELQPEGPAGAEA